MELRVLHTAAYGYTWYGSYGYTFGRGPYNTSEHEWQAAGHYITQSSLANLLYDFEGVESGVPAIVHRYLLPVSGAARVKDLGSLLYRLLWLQSHPQDALLFFDPGKVAAATAAVRKSDNAEAEKRAAQRAASTQGKRPPSGPKLALLQPPPLSKTLKKRNAAAAAAAATTTTPAAVIPLKPASTKFKLKMGGSSKRGLVDGAPATRQTRTDPSTFMDTEDNNEEDNEEGGGGAERRPAKRHRTNVSETASVHAIGRHVQAYYKDKRAWYHGVVEKRDAATG